jgi:hypothetical protein
LPEYYDTPGRYNFFPFLHISLVPFQAGSN